MKVLNLVIAAIEQVDFPDDNLEKHTTKFLEQLEKELDAVGFTPSSELGAVADDLEEALTDYYAESNGDGDEDDMERDEDTLPIPDEKVEP